MKLIVRESQKLSIRILCVHTRRLAFFDVRNILFIPHCLLSD